ncbi:hypothetical protein [Catenulispora rubra]|uniref:hypothetical protein n=1 Tax=Catenulispora rubra TaxID=280293 RepID=UPI001892843D|nr:hypothetical protein [Catenulispora rubra]
MGSSKGWSGPDPAQLRLPPADVVEHTIEVCGRLKEELVDYAQKPRFSKQFKAALAEAVGPGGVLDSSTAITAIDRFILQKKQFDGTTIVRRFADQRRPAFGEEEKATLLRWQEVVEGCFEVRERLDGGLLLHNLLDDLLYPTWATAGADVLKPMKPGSFVVARVVPARADFDMWLFSGPQASYGQQDGPVLVQAAVETFLTDPRVMRRNTELMAMAWQRQAEERAAFIDFAGTDLVVDTPRNVQTLLVEFYKLRQPIPSAAASSGHPVPGPEDFAAFPDEILASDSVAVVYDDAEGIHYFNDFAAAAEPFTVPAEQLTPARLTTLRGYLNSDSIPPFLFRRLAAEHPDNVDQVFAKLLGKNGFRWDRDGEAMLARKKPTFLHHEPTPSITVLPTRLAELRKAAGPRERGRQ